MISGSPMNLECKFSGIPDPEIEWLKDGGTIEENDRVTSCIDGDIARLTITKTEPDDEGWYRCRVFNDRGAVFTEAELIVVEPPKFLKDIQDVEVDEGVKLYSL